MIVVTVLKSGGIYTPEWVTRLRDNVTQFSDAEFVCFSDVKIPGVWTIPLHHKWPGWWSKIEAFQFQCEEETCLYLDLDTDIVGPLDWMDYNGDFAMISDFYAPDRAQSGAMAWRGTYVDRLYQTFAKNSEENMRRFRGDGQWLHANSRPNRLQGLYPGRIVSHKVHCRDGVPPEASIVCYHGKPKRWPDGEIR